MKLYQRALDADPKAIQQINGNLDPPRNTKMFFIIEKQKNFLDFSQRTLGVL